MVNNKKQSKLTKTAAKEERTDRKKQMDLRQALSNTPRNRKISDSETRSTSPQKRQSHSVSPEKESRRTSKRLQRLQLKHAGEIKAIEQTQKQPERKRCDLEYHGRPIRNSRRLQNSAVSSGTKFYSIN